ncbi:MAG: hypothetical protein IPJ34_00195 [Myxococcales bacterium]|nr:hypothetical protein [Myxococcales bacterium]
MTDSKKTILARRAKFVAAAIAGAGFTSACASQACLDVPAPDATTDTATDTLDGGADTGPTVCLSADAPPPDSGTPDVDASDTSPVPCLDIAPDTGADSDGATG